LIFTPPLEIVLFAPNFRGSADPLKFGANSTISRGGVKINLSCYMIKLWLWPLVKIWFLRGWRFKTYWSSLLCRARRWTCSRVSNICPQPADPQRFAAQGWGAEAAWLGSSTPVWGCRCWTDTLGAMCPSVPHTPDCINTSLSLSRSRKRLQQRN